MRRLAIIVSLVGAAAFAALLAWGLTFGGTVQADDETTPTATVEATETATVVADETATVVADETPAADETPTATATFVAPCPPVPLGTLIGAVTIDGNPAPAGTTITVSKGGEVFGQAVVATAGQYVVDVTNNRVGETAPPCFTDILETLTITCDSAVATQSITSLTGPTDLDLTCISTEAPTPTVVPTPSPTTVVVSPTPVVTPTVLPPTGMGSTSGDGGSTWWALALAAAALTSVAGLLTARWARR